MLIEAVFGVIAWILDLLLLPMDIQELPETFYTVLGTLIAKLIRGATIISNYIHGTYIVALLGFVVAFDTAILVYHVILYILRKIPFINIK